MSSDTIDEAKLSKDAEQDNEQDNEPDEAEEKPVKEKE